MKIWLGTIALCCGLIGCGGDDSGDDDGSNDAGTDAGLQADASVARTVSGIVMDHRGESAVPLAGATVSVRDASPAISDTTPANGTFTLMVPEGTATVFIEATDFADLAFPLVVPASGRTELELEPVATVEVDAVVTALDRTWSSTDGIVVVSFDDPPPEGAGATISADADDAFVFDDTGAPAVRDTLVANGGESVIYTNATAGTTTISLINPDGQTCTMAEDIADWPVIAGAITQVRAHCE